MWGSESFLSLSTIDSHAESEEHQVECYVCNCASASLVGYD